MTGKEKLKEEFEEVVNPETYRERAGEMRNGFHGGHVNYERLYFRMKRMIADYLDVEVR